ncbi:MAG TPA: DUF262 domain-containing protein [Ktedonobacteraceae bacterium]|jgi:hypothetical protein
MEQRSLSDLPEECIAMAQVPTRNEGEFEEDRDAGELDVEPEETGGEDRITRPFNPARIRVDTKPITIDLLLSRIAHEELDLNPNFQRKEGLWSEKTQSQLIESILVRIPLPSFYLDATDDDRWLVIDGLQRLTTLKRFMMDKALRLSKMEFLTELNGKTYDELPRPFQRRLKETQVTVFLIDKGTPSEVKFNIFKRINTGGLPLSPQEIRHALNQGKATGILERLAQSEEFQRATNRSIRSERMADRECVLRFFAFTITSYLDYKSQEFDSFLSDCMAMMNRMEDSELKRMEELFKKAMVAAYAIFGTDAFRKRYEKKASRYPINKALFESWSVNLSKLNDQQLGLLQACNGLLQQKFIQLMQNHEFDRAISQGTGDIKKVIARFDEIKQIIREVLA